MPTSRLSRSLRALYTGARQALGATLLAAVVRSALADEPARIERNVFVPMRDGVRLAADLYLPAGTQGARHPAVLIRTPYGKDSYHRSSSSDPAHIFRFFVEHGYAVVVQDKRGRFHSEGSYVLSGADDVDGYDTVDWISKQAWSSARVGAYGCSYEGDVQIFMAGAKHPALKALIPQASGSSVGSLGGHYRYFGARVGGAVEWVGSIGWFAQNGQKVMPRLPADLPRERYNASTAFWDVTRREPPVDYARAWQHLPMKEALSAQGLPPTDFEDTLGRPVTDPYWAALPYMTASYTSDVPALFINSWYDFGADMTLLQFEHFRRHSLSETARHNQFAIMSPHTHCAFEQGAAEHSVVGERDVGDTRLDYRGLYLTWFDAWLKDDRNAQRALREWPKLRYYAMGRNRWQSAPGWPVTGTAELSLYLASAGAANSLLGDGRLLPTPVETSAARSDRFTYDPANPVPSRGGAMCCTGTVDATPGAMDQRSVEARADVLVYTSEALTQELEVTGNVRAVLHVSSDAIDTDFTAKLVDVYPDGRAFNVLEGILRARHREGLDREVWMQPGRRYELTIPLGATSNVFLPGHRIRLEIASSNFPRFDRNMNLGGDNLAQTHWVLARNEVHHTPELRSRLILPVVSGTEPPTLPAPK